MGSLSKSRTTKLPRKEKNCADSNCAAMPAIWWRLVILRYAMMLATDDYTYEYFSFDCKKTWRMLIDLFQGNFSHFLSSTWNFLIQGNL